VQYLKVSIFLFLIRLLIIFQCQQTKKQIQPKFNRLFGNISRECLKEYGVTPGKYV